MAVPMALMAVGTALQIFGNLRANALQAESELRNARYYEDQANFVRDAMARESMLASARYEATKGAQISAALRGGADISGSVAGIIADTVAKKALELKAIKSKGELDYKLAVMRGRSSREAAAQLKDPMMNILQSATLLTKNVTANTEVGSGLFSMIGGIERPARGSSPAAIQPMDTGGTGYLGFSGEF
jgi:hypothetical protein